MKISQLLSESSNYEKQLKNDVNAYLVRMKANGILTIDTNVLVGELNDMGHEVTPESLVDFLKKSKYTSNVTVDSIELVGAPAEVAKDNHNRDVVKKLAKKAASEKRIS
jgi:sorbitol-specific phosphotransferase system component IIBC